MVRPRHAPREFAYLASPQHLVDARLDPVKRSLQPQQPACVLRVEIGCPVIELRARPYAPRDDQRLAPRKDPERRHAPVRQHHRDVFAWQDPELLDHPVTEQHAEGIGLQVREAPLLHEAADDRLVEVRHHALQFHAHDVVVGRHQSRGYDDRGRRPYAGHPEHALPDGVRVVERRPSEQREVRDDPQDTFFEFPLEPVDDGLHEEQDAHGQRQSGQRHHADEGKEVVPRPGVTEPDIDGQRAKQGRVRRSAPVTRARSW